MESSQPQQLANYIRGLIKTCELKVQLARIKAHVNERADRLAVEAKQSLGRPDLSTLKGLARSNVL